MCIALISTAHPSYPLIVIDNRDEFLRRPTSCADWWPEPSTNVLGGRDLARATHGTWMGVTKEGKLAVLTNYRETTADEPSGVHSRGLIVNNWLTADPEQRQSTRDFVQGMVASSEIRNVGGFSLVCGYVNEPLAIVSNRSANMDQISWIATEKGQTLGLSNTTFGDRSWPKILDGEKLMKEAINAHVQAGEDEDQLISRLLHVLSRDTLPRLSGDSTLETYLLLLRQSIFVPVIGAQAEKSRAADEVAAARDTDRVPVESQPPHDLLDKSFLQGAYGTQKQTVVLVSANGRVRYFERTLYDNDVNAIPIGKGDRSFEFHVSR
ncbi:hypothetical protein Asppvi_007547 [Aspergillus pseudoviridinutans]|uniref:DUF833-domain-containing protein n=1 Tax=Aspergillus pseudoviridinutans TaxID=1517512 RepID=A0A9P3BC05_9EURO|nr:uncharacterized protein Asppvi_007547 [Aspergillus pseudoviridinutans]GIJ88622.1 hypothetical protein Asppvi_007547 [Aspergillus pseudoviridinutans]